MVISSIFLIYWFFFFRFMSQKIVMKTPCSTFQYNINLLCSAVIPKHHMILCDELFLKSYMVLYVLSIIHLYFIQRRIFFTNLVYIEFNSYGIIVLWMYILLTLGFVPIIKTFISMILSNLKNFFSFCIIFYLYKSILL